MKYFKYLFVALVLALPIYSHAGSPNRINVMNTDQATSILNTSFISTQLTSPYDLRNRQSYIQITNTHSTSVEIHIQIFQHDRDCTELDFFDELTPNDTVIYDFDNIVKNNGSSVPVNLQDDSSGYVVVTITNTQGRNRGIIGNFRIIDQLGNYEYRSNMAAELIGSSCNTSIDNSLRANFNTIDQTMYADVIGYGYEKTSLTTATNIEQGYNFDIFVFDLDEEPLSCDTKNFACGNIMNYGINEDYTNSISEDLLCPGGGLANPNGGFISFENGVNLDSDDDSLQDVFIGFIGINNNNGTGSMDAWIYGSDVSCES